MTELKNYSHPDFHRFIRDIENANFEVGHYRGRNFWQGPAVIVESIDMVTSLTTVKCQSDNMGLDFIVYPAAKDSSIEEGPYIRPAIIEGDLRICHVPQLPLKKGCTFYVSVRTLREAQLVHDVLTAYDLFQYDTDIKPDYTNTCWLETYNGEEWVEWRHPEQEYAFEEYLFSTSDNIRPGYTLKFK